MRVKTRAIAAVIVAVVVVVAGIVAYVYLTQPKTLTPVTVSTDYILAGYHAPFYVAQQKGYYSSQGLSVTIEQGHGSLSTAELVAAGKAQFGLVDFDTMVLGHMKGVNVTAVMLYSYNSGMGYGSFSPLNSPSDIANKTFGVCPNTGASAVMLPVLMKSQNLDPNSVTYDCIQPSAAVSAFLQGKFQIVSSFLESEVPVIQSEAAGRPYYNLLASKYLAIYGYAIVTTPQMIQTEPNVVSAFVKATIQGVQYSLANPSSAVSIMKGQVPSVGNTTVVEQQLNNMKQLMSSSYAMSNYGMFDPARTPQVINTVSTAYNVTNINTASLYTNQFVPTGQTIP